MGKKCLTLTHLFRVRFVPHDCGSTISSSIWCSLMLSTSAIHTTMKSFKHNLTMDLIHLHSTFSFHFVLTHAFSILENKPYSRNPPLNPCLKVHSGYRMTNLISVVIYSTVTPSEAKSIDLEGKRWRLTHKSMRNSSTSH